MYLIPNSLYLSVVGKKVIKKLIKTRQITGKLIGVPGGIVGTSSDILDGTITGKLIGAPGDILGISGDILDKPIIGKLIGVSW